MIKIYSFFHSSLKSSLKSSLNKKNVKKNFIAKKSEFAFQKKIFLQTQT